MSQDLMRLAADLRAYAAELSREEVRRELIAEAERLKSQAKAAREEKRAGMPEGECARRRGLDLLSSLLISSDTSEDIRRPSCRRA